MTWEHQHRCRVKGCEVHLGEGPQPWSAADKAQIFAAHKLGRSQREIAEEFGTDQNRVWRILKGLS